MEDFDFDHFPHFPGIDLTLWLRLVLFAIVAVSLVAVALV